MAIYHLNVTVGSRGSGHSASAKNEYIEREGPHTHDAAEREHVEHGNMPEWAQDDPRAYWRAADEHERANGSLYREVEFALPKELSADERKALAVGFASQLADAGEAGKLPYTLAIHKGGQDGKNPHAHLMISERANDGIARSPEQWFKRANTAAPEKGGAKKYRKVTTREWLVEVRKDWAEQANHALGEAHRTAFRDHVKWEQDRAARERDPTRWASIDHRTLAAQCGAAHRRSQDPEQSAEERQRAQARAVELSREPTGHLGPQASNMYPAPGKSDPVDPNDAVRERNRDREQARAEPDHEAAETRTRISRLEDALEHIAAAIRETWDRITRARDERLRPPQPERGWER